MRKKTPKAVVTFASTSDAMAVEAAARETGLPGRMIPIPSEVSAGCGLAWCSPEGEKGRLGILLKKENVEWEDMVQMLF